MGPSNSKGLKLRVADLISQLRDENIDVSGLMTMGVPGDMAATRVVFERLRKLADTLSFLNAQWG